MIERWVAIVMTVTVIIAVAFYISCLESFSFTPVVYSSVGNLYKSYPKKSVVPNVAPAAPPMPACVPSTPAHDHDHH